MYDTTHYDSPLGSILLEADEKGLSGLWFDEEKSDARCLPPEHRKDTLPVLDKTKRWLDIYFAGHAPDFMPPLHITGSSFQMAVWDILREIPYGETTTYGAIAKKIANQKNLKQMSAQAVGGAVGRNKISIIIPCHRVIGSDGSLTGYAGGVDKKAALLQLEGFNMTGLKIPVNERSARFHKYAGFWKYIGL